MSTKWGRKHKNKNLGLSLSPSLSQVREWRLFAPLKSDIYKWVVQQRFFCEIPCLGSSFFSPEFTYTFLQQILRNVDVIVRYNVNFFLE